MIAVKRGQVDIRDDVHFYHRLAYTTGTELSEFQVNFHVGRGGPSLNGIPHGQLLAWDRVAASCPPPANDDILIDPTPLVEEAEIASEQSAQAIFAL
jgi:hypothetical protein